MRNKWKLGPQIFIRDLERKWSLENFFHTFPQMIWQQKSLCQMAEYCSSASLHSLTSLQPSILHCLKWNSPSDKEHFTMSNTWTGSQKYFVLRKIWGLYKLWKTQKPNASDCQN